MKVFELGLLACFAASVSAAANLLFVEGFEGVELALAQNLSAITTVVNTTQWSQMSAHMFMSYDAIIIGDPGCTYDPTVLSFMVNNSAIWGPVVTGNIIVLGNSPTYSYNGNGDVGARNVIDAAIYFAAVGHGTGLYLSLSCYYSNSPQNTPVDALSYFGDFEVEGIDYVGCYNYNEQIVASGPGLDLLTDNDLNFNYACNYFEFFTQFPSFGPFAFEAFAIAGGVLTSGSELFFNGNHTVVGTPYIITRGGIPDGCGDGVWEPLLGEQCDGGAGCCPCCQCDVGYTASGQGTCICTSPECMPSSSSTPLLMSSSTPSLQSSSTPLPTSLASSRFANNSVALDTITVTPVPSTSSILTATSAAGTYVTPTAPEIYIIGVEIIIFIDITINIDINGVTTWNTTPISTGNKPIWNTDIPGYPCYFSELKSQGMCGCDRQSFVTVTTTSCSSIPDSCTWTPSPPTIQPCSTCLPYTMSTFPSYNSTVTENVIMVPQMTPNTQQGVQTNGGAVVTPTPKVQGGGVAVPTGARTWTMPMSPPTYVPVSGGLGRFRSVDALFAALVAGVVSVVALS